MRWIKATDLDTKGDVWINMAQVFTISVEQADTGPYTHLWSSDGVFQNVLESPEHLVAPFR